jgi:hypothetical protein
LGNVASMKIEITQSKLILATAAFVLYNDDDANAHAHNTPVQQEFTLWQKCQHERAERNFIGNLGRGAAVISTGSTGRLLWPWKNALSP